MGDATVTEARDHGPGAGDVGAGRRAAGGGGVQRMAMFARYLPESGWTPVVLTSAPGKTQQIDRQKSDSEKPLGEWNAIDVVCRGDAIEVTINGVAQNRVTGSKPAAGKIGFQLEGQPYELRNVRFTPLE